MNKRLVSFLTAVIFIFFSFSTALAKDKGNAKSLDKALERIEKLQSMSDGKLKIYMDKKDGLKLFLSGKLSEKGEPGEKRAVEFIRGNKDLFGLSNFTGNFKIKEVIKDELGFTHVKLNQVINNLKVRNKEIVVHFNKDGVITTVNGDLENEVSSITALGMKKITEEQAINAAKLEVQIQNPIREVGVERQILVKDKSAYEVYRVNLASSLPNPANWDIFVESTSGKILDKVNNIRFDGAVTGSGTAVDGTTKSLNLYLSGTSYQMIDTTKPMTGQIKTYTANNAVTQPGTLVANTSSTFTSTTYKAAVSAHYYAGVVYDFYKNLFSRNSIDNNGMSIISTVHYDSAYNNAFWDGTQMVYGDGDGTTFTYLSGDLDVVAHEMSHGVDSYTADLTYSYQSGALNESMSDVLGVLIATYDKYNVKSGGTWSFNTGDWVVGDGVYTPGTPGDALRSLADPTLYDQPAHMNNYYNTTSDNGGVHTNSGIPNKAAYLVAQSIGCEKTARIYYRAMANYMTTSTDFLGARNTLIQSATDLYGAGGAEVTAISNAFDSVGVVQVSDFYEPNDTTSQAYAVTSGTTYNSYIASTTDVDYYKFTTSAAGTISISLTNLPGDYDLYLINSSGTTVAKSENGNTTSESISYSAAIGTYYVKVSGYNGAYSTSVKYALKATYPTSGGVTDPYEPNDTTSQAYAVTSDTTYNSYIASTTDVDYYKFTTAAAGTISISLTNLPGDYDLYLINSSGTTVAKSENGGTTSESISYSAAIGTYYVKVSGYSGAYSTSVKYALKATYPTSGGTADTYEPNNTTSQAYAITSGTNYTSYIYSSTDVDYYKITVASAGTVTINLTTLPKDYDLYLINSAGTTVASSLNGSTTSESITYSAGSAGTYYIKIIGYSGVYSTTVKYTLNATFPY